jgi:hypothetical protein
MTVCGDCGFEAKNGTGLAAHRRAKHPVSDGPVSAVAAVRRRLGSRSGEPLGVAALMLATAMDDTSSVRDLPALSRELRTVLDVLGLDVDVEANSVDDLAARRAARRAAAAGDARSTTRQ